MQTYLIRRPGIAAGANELDAALMRLRAFEEQPSAVQAQWLHSYVLHEADGRLGLACLFRADSAAALRRHAESTRLPAGEILPVFRTLVVRPFAPARVHLVRCRCVWQDAAELARSTEAARRDADAQTARPVVCLCRYAVREDDGTLGSVSLYQAVDAPSLAEHTQRAGVPIDETTPVIGRVVFRKEPLTPPFAINAAAG